MGSCHLPQGLSGEGCEQHWPGLLPRLGLKSGGEKTGCERCRPRAQAEDPMWPQTLPPGDAWLPTSSVQKFLQRWAGAPDKDTPGLGGLREPPTAWTTLCYVGWPALLLPTPASGTPSGVRVHGAVLRGCPRTLGCSCLGRGHAAVAAAAAVAQPHPTPVWLAHPNTTAWQGLPWALNPVPPQEQLVPWAEKHPVGTQRGLGVGAGWAVRGWQKRRTGKTARERGGAFQRPHWEHGCPGGALGLAPCTRWEAT